MCPSLEGLSWTTRVGTSLSFRWLQALTRARWPACTRPRAAVAGDGESLDYSGFDAPQVDAGLEQASANLDPARAATTYQEVDRLLWQAMPAIPLFCEPTLIVSSADVSGVQGDAWGTGPLWDAAGWTKLVPAANRATTTRP